MRRLAFLEEQEWLLAAGQTARHLRRGGLLGYPTETVYGFGCTPEPGPLERLAALKRTGPGHPFLLLAARQDQLPRLRWTPAARRIARAFWPGPLTLVLAADESLPPQVRGEDDTVAVRVTSHPGVRVILEALDAPITSTSANPPGAVPAASAAETEAAITALGGADDWLVLDGGTLPASSPSTLVRCVGDDVVLLRAGAIDFDTIRSLLGETDVRA